MGNKVDLKLTPELKEKLRGFMGFSSNPEFLYTPKVYREKDGKGNYTIPKELWPVFKLKGKDGVEIAQEEDNAGYVDSRTSNIHLTTGKKRIEVLQTNILGWRNLKDFDSGEEIPFKKVDGQAYKTCIKRLPAPLQRELHDAINEQSILSEEEKAGLEF